MKLTGKLYLERENSRSSFCDYTPKCDNYKIPYNQWREFFDAISKEAASNNGEYQYYLSKCYHNGIGCLYNKKLANYWAMMSERNSYLPAILDYCDTYIIKYNYDADNIIPKGIYSVCGRKYTGDEYYQYSKLLYEKYDNPKYIAYCYKHGIGVNKDDKMALELFIKDFELTISSGCDYDDNIMEFYCYKGRFVTPYEKKNIEIEGLEDYLVNLANNGDLWAARFLVKFYRDNKFLHDECVSKEHYIYWLKYLSDRNVAFAMYNLAFEYIDGKYIEKDEDLGISYLEKACKYGKNKFYYQQLAHFYAYKRADMLTPQKAFELYSMNKGDNKAVDRLIDYYYRYAGLGFKDNCIRNPHNGQITTIYKSPELVREYLQKMAESGIPESQYYYAWTFHEPSEHTYWLIQSFNQGYVDAGNVLVQYYMNDYKKSPDVQKACEFNERLMKLAPEKAAQNELNMIERHLIERPDDERMLFLYTQTSCFNKIADMYAQGIGVRKSMYLSYRFEKLHICKNLGCYSLRGYVKKFRDKCSDNFLKYYSRSESNLACYMMAGSDTFEKDTVSGLQLLSELYYRNENGIDLSFAHSLYYGVGCEHNEKHKDWAMEILKKEKDRGNVKAIELLAKL